MLYMEVQVQSVHGLGFSCGQNFVGHDVYVHVPQREQQRFAQPPLKGNAMSCGRMLVVMCLRRFEVLLTPTFVSFCTDHCEYWGNCEEEEQSKCMRKKVSAGGTK